MDKEIQRLEAVTSRLEALVGHLSAADAGGQSSSGDDSGSSVDHLPIIRDYDALVNDSVKSFVAVSKKIGGDLNTMSDHVRRLFEAQEQFIKQAVQSKKPTDEQIKGSIKAQSSEIEAITGKS